MIWDLTKFTRFRKTTILLLSVVFFFASMAATDVCAQKKFSKVYPASKNVRLQLTNRTGTVMVEGWERDEINISAYLEAPAAKIVPQSLSGTIYHQSRQRQSRQKRSRQRQFFNQSSIRRFG